LFLVIEKLKGCRQYCSGRARPFRLR
jgi:hypothetical protein